MLQSLAELQANIAIYGEIIYSLVHKSLISQP